MGIALGLLYVCFIACVFSLECVLLFRFRSITKTRLLTFATVIMGWFSVDILLDNPSFVLENRWKLLILLCQVATAVLVITHIIYDVYHSGGMDWGKGSVLLYFRYFSKRISGITNCVWTCGISFCSFILLSCAIYQKKHKSTDFEVPPSFPPPYLHPLGIPLKEHAPVVVLSPAPPSYKSSHHSSHTSSSRPRPRSPSKLVCFTPF